MGKTVLISSHIKRYRRGEYYEKEENREAVAPDDRRRERGFQNSKEGLSE